MNVVCSAFSYILRDMKWEINHFSLSIHNVKWGGEGGRSSGFATHAQKAAGSGTGKPFMSHIQREDLSLSNL